MEAQRVAQPRLGLRQRPSCVPPCALQSRPLCAPSTSATRSPCDQAVPLGLGRRAASLFPASGIQSRQVVRGADADSFAPSAPPAPEPPPRMADTARKALQRATSAMNRYGWLAFWMQLVCASVSGVVLLFSVAFTSQTGPRASLYLTMVGIVAGFVSTAWNFAYTRTSNKMQKYLDALPGQAVEKVKKQQVISLITRGVFINLLGLGSTLIGVQALVGLLVAKTLTNATVNPTLGGYNPVLALDVFLVQAATNTLLGHFLSMCISLLLLNVVGEGRGLQFQRLLKKERRAKNVRLLRRNDGSIRGDMMVLEGRLKGNTGKYRLEIPRSEMQLFGGTGGKAFGFSMPPLAPPKKPAAAPTFDSWGGGGSSGGSGSSSGQLTVEAAAETAGAIAPTPALAMVSSYDEDLAQWAARRASGAAASTRGGSSGAAGTRSSSGSGSGGGSAYLQRYDTDVLFLPTDASLRYLDGSLPGDYGFDPLGLYDPATLASLTGGADGWFSQDYVRYSEVLHGRWAMLAAVGCLVPEMRPTSGALDPGIVWFRTGFIPSQSTVDYGIDLYDLCLLQAVVMGLLEARRFQDFLSPGSPPTLLPLLAPLAELERAAVAAQSSGGGTAAAPATSGGSRDPVYPGGPLFSPLMLVESEGALREFKLKEIKHGRLAMVALLGYTAQAVATQQGPFENLMQHLRDPLHNNIIFTVMRLAAAAQQARQFDADFL